MSIKKSKRPVNNYRDVNAAYEFHQEQAIREDIKKRFKDYDDDPSIGNMYQRKKKSTKSKTKRKNKRGSK